LGERHHDCDEHPCCPDLVPTACGCRIGQEAQRQDERHDRDQVEEVRDLAAQGSAFFSRFLNISSMRSVTTKPPTTFAEASTTAIRPTIVVSVSLWPRPATSIAPT